MTITKAQYDKKMKFLDQLLSNDRNIDQQKVNRIAQLQPKQSLFILDDFLAIDKAKALDTSRIGYNPFEGKTYNRRDYLAPAVAEFRHLSRYKMIYGTVDFDETIDFVDTYTPLSVMSICAINLSGTSPRDLQDFTVGENQAGYELNTVKYEQECNKLAEFIVSTAKKQNNQKLIMPAFGVGVYISKLTSDSKKKATAIMYKAFATAAEKHQLAVDWIVYADSDDEKVNEQARQTVATLDGYAKNKFMSAVIHHDLIDYSLNESYVKECVMLNPGSDRTIGGRYTHPNPKTLEEQIAQRSNLMEVQSSTFNKSLDAKLEKELKARSNTEAVISTSMTRPINKEFFNDLGWGINKTFGVSKPMIFALNNDFNISFKTPVDANLFLKSLAGHYNLQYPSVKRDANGYFLVKLNKMELDFLAKISLESLVAIEPAKTQMPSLGERSIEQIKQVLLSESQITAVNNGAFFIYFNDQKHAEQFANGLAGINITSEKNPGQTKQVWQQANSNRFYVVLSESHLHQLRLSLRPISASTSQPAKPSEADVLIQRIIKLNINNKPTHSYYSNGNSKVEFSNNDDAHNFVLALDKMNIKSEKGTIKAVREEKGSFVVVLTPSQRKTFLNNTTRAEPNRLFSRNETSFNDAPPARNDKTFK